jgi:hypothetical protein
MLCRDPRLCPGGDAHSNARFKFWTRPLGDEAFRSPHGGERLIESRSQPSEILHDPKPILAF